MDPIIDELSVLEDESRKLEISQEERERITAEVLKTGNHFLNDLEKVRTFNNDRPNKASFVIEDISVPISNPLDILESEVFPKGLNAASGGHLGYIPGGG